jgi:hypothetical protein
MPKSGIEHKLRKLENAGTKLRGEGAILGSLMLRKLTKKTLPPDQLKAWVSRLDEIGDSLLKLMK